MVLPLLGMVLDSVYRMAALRSWVVLAKHLSPQASSSSPVGGD